MQKLDPGGADTSINFMMMLSEALNEFSSSQFSLASVQALTMQLLTNIETTQSQNEMDNLNAIAKSMNKMVSQGYYVDSSGKKHYENDSKDDSFANEMTNLNTQFSTDMQEGNMCVQMIQSFVQSAQTASQLTMSGIQGMSSMYSLIGQLYQQISGLIAQ